MQQTEPIEKKKPSTSDSSVRLSPGCKIILGDCIEVLAELPPESIDMIFADPPYNLSNGGFTCHAGRAVSVNKGEWDRSEAYEAI